MKLPFLKSSKITEAEVSEKIFGVEINKDLIAQLIKIYIENSHPGTKAQKNRSAVRGGGKKPWRQKGTGRARAGTTRSPIWRSGGVTFAAKPQNFSQKVNKKMYRAAMQSIWSELVRQGRLVITDDLGIDSPKTKALAAKLSALELTNVLIVAGEVSDALYLSARNLPHVDVRDADAIDPVSLISFEKVLVTVDALKAIEEQLA